MVSALTVRERFAEGEERVKLMKSMFVLFVRKVESSVAMAQPMFLSENGHCVPNKIPKILKIFKGVEGAKAEGHVSALRNWIICSCVIQTALIWLMAWLQIKAM